MPEAGVCCRLQQVDGVPHEPFGFARFLSIIMSSTIYIIDCIDFCDPDKDIVDRCVVGGRRAVLQLRKLEPVMKSITLIHLFYIPGNLIMGAACGLSDESGKRAIWVLYLVSGFLLYAAKLGMNLWAYFCLTIPTRWFAFEKAKGFFFRHPEYENNMVMYTVDFFEYSVTVTEKVGELVEMEISPDSLTLRAQELGVEIQGSVRFLLYRSLWKRQLDFRCHFHLIAYDVLIFFNWFMLICLLPVATPGSGAVNLTLIYSMIMLPVWIYAWMLLYMCCIGCKNFALCCFSCWDIILCGLLKPSFGFSDRLWRRLLVACYGSRPLPKEDDKITSKSAWTMPPVPEAQVPEAKQTGEHKQ
eukprot:490575-Amphidinium_carterae.2